MTKVPSAALEFIAAAGREMGGDTSTGDPSPRGRPPIPSRSPLSVTETVWRKLHPARIVGEEERVAAPRYCTDGPGFG